MRIHCKTAKLLAPALLLMAPAIANAFIVDSTTLASETFDVSWELMGASVDNPVGVDLSGTATFEFLGFEQLVSGNTSVRFGLSLSNGTTTTTSTVGSTSFTDIGLAAFGFGTDGNYQIASWGTSGDGSNGTSDGGQIGTVASYDPATQAPPGGSTDLNDPGAGSMLTCADDLASTDPDVVDNAECVEIVVVPVTSLGANATDSFEFVLDLGVLVGGESPSVEVNPFAVAYDYDIAASSTGGSPGSIVVSAAQVPVPAPLLLVGAGMFVMRRMIRTAA